MFKELTQALYATRDALGVFAQSADSAGNLGRPRRSRLAGGSNRRLRTSRRVLVRAGGGGGYPDTRIKTPSDKSALPWLRKMGRVSGITAGSSCKERQARRNAQAQANADLESLRGTK